MRVVIFARSAVARNSHRRAAERLKSSRLCAIMVSSTGGIVIMRYFNIAGPCNKAEHYMIEAASRLSGV
ncbi:MAG: hypothetical protein LBL96_00375, partial [Clostridiales bacterium]|nr:hypothetical protein [Clostridiales bacterium]